MTGKPETAVTKCGAPIGGRIPRWCDGMKLAMTGALDNSTTKGLSPMAGWLDGDPPGTRARILGVTYRPSARTGSIVLNFCPWCGERIHPEQMAKVVAESGEKSG